MMMLYSKEIENREDREYLYRWGELSLGAGTTARKEGVVVVVGHCASSK